MRRMQLFVLALFLGNMSGITYAGEGNCDEHFMPGPEIGWTREPGSSTAALAWPAPGGPAGLAFDPALGFGSMWRPVDLGASGCELSCEVELTRGLAEPWRWPGVAVALASMNRRLWARMTGRWSSPCTNRAYA